MLLLTVSELSNRPSLKMGVVVTVDHCGSDAAAAVSSVLNQTQAADEVIIVSPREDDSSANLISGLENACLIRESADIAAARNIAIEKSTSDCLLFVNSNDVLLPVALETGRRFLESHPDVDVALFDFEWTDHTRRPAWPSGRKNHNGDDPLLHLLAGDLAFSHAGTFYRRRVFDSVGQFRPSVAAASDRDLLLRAAQHLRLAADNTVVAKSIPPRTGQREVFAATCASLRQVDLAKRPREYSEMRRRGIAAAEESYGGQLWTRIRASAHDRRLSISLAKDLFDVGSACPRLVGRELKQFARNALGKRIYGVATTQQKQVHHIQALARLQLQGANRVSAYFGFDRGQPVDRYYIEQFLNEKSAAIRGRVLEIKNNDYTVKFGAGRVSQSDVLHPDPAWPEATIHGNLTDSYAFESDVFDCVILTQTLHLIYDVRAVLRTMVKILKPGGTLLITTPCLSTIYHLDEPSHLNLDQDSWRMTRWSFEKLLREFFPAGNVEVKAAGNLAANTAFLYGLAVEDLPPGVLDQNDEDNEMLLLAVAIK